jgi:hypothetical protein
MSTYQVAGIFMFATGSVCICVCVSIQFCYYLVRRVPVGGRLVRRPRNVVQSGICANISFQAYMSSCIGLISIQPSTYKFVIIHMIAN